MIIVDINKQEQPNPTTETEQIQEFIEKIIKDIERDKEAQYKNIAYA